MKIQFNVRFLWFDLNSELRSFKVNSAKRRQSAQSEDPEITCHFCFSANSSKTLWIGPRKVSRWFRMTWVIQFSIEFLYFFFTPKKIYHFSMLELSRGRLLEHQIKGEYHVNDPNFNLGLVTFPIFYVCTLLRYRKHRKHRGNGETSMISLNSRYQFSVPCDR